MIVVPDSDIILIKSPLKLDNYNQITFSNATEQYNYFIGLPHLGYRDCTYQRKDGVIRFDTDNERNPSALRFEELLQYNYCMYKNESYEDKWFYAFITDCKYINDGMSEITIDTDAFQTWQFELNYKNSFVEREHVSNDTIGLHTIPENVELGEYIISAWNKNDTLANNSILVASTIDLSTYAENGGGVYGGVYQGFKLYRFSNTSSGILALQNKLVQMNIDQKLDSIVAIYLANPLFYDMSTFAEGDPINESTSVRGFTWGNGVPTDTPITKPSTLAGYNPKNNKLFTYPYCYLLMDNGNGGQAVYRFENFHDPINANNCEFDIIGTPTIGGSFYCTPVNYANNVTSDNFKEKLVGGKLPTCGYQNDIYINWLTQNACNITTGYISDSINTIAGVGSSLGGNPGGLMNVSTGLMGIANTLYDLHVHSLQPPQHVGNASIGDVNFASRQTTFTAYTMTIKNEYAKMIDDYFSMYGYKVNSLKTPNIHKRSNWDFIKCIDVNLEGDIPEADMSKIRALFNNGCTFWHTTSYFLDYSRTNSIL